MPPHGRQMALDSDDGSIEVTVEVCDEAPGVDYAALIAAQAAIDYERRHGEDVSER